METAVKPVHDGRSRKRRWPAEQKLADGVKNHPELGVVLFLQRLKLPGQVCMGGKHLAQSNECAHDFDIDLDGTLTSQHAGKHCYALLGKHIGQVPPTASPSGF